MNFNDLKIISIHDKYLIILISLGSLDLISTICRHPILLLIIGRYSFCRLTKSIVVLMIFCGGLHLSHGEKLKCQFHEGELSYVGKVYYCYVRSLDNSFNNMTIDGYTGAHLANKNDADVKGIWIHNTNTK